MHNSWNADLFNPKSLSRKAKAIALEIKKDKDALGLKAIAVCGVSGLVIGGLISHLSHLPLIVIRKEGEDSHSGYDVLFKDRLSGNCCIVDDLISSGDTVRRMTELLVNRNFTLKKIYLYHDFGSNPDSFNDVPVWLCED